MASGGSSPLREAEEQRDRFFYFDHNSGVVSLATMSCSLVLSFHQFLL
jgi:hypothetical protein